MPVDTACCASLRRWLSPGLFRALGDPNRLAILVALSDGGKERTVSDVAGCCPVDLSVVSRHLRTLREAGVVDARRQGKEVFYRVQFGALIAMLRGLADALEACCPSERARETARPPSRSRSRLRRGEA